MSPEPEHFDPSIVESQQLSVEDVLRLEHGYAQIIKIYPELQFVVEALTAEYNHSENKNYAELWLRGLNILNILALSQSEQLEEEMDAKFMRHFVEGHIKSAMSESMSMREVDLIALETFRRIPAELVDDYEIVFYEAIDGMMGSEGLETPNVHDYQW